MVVNCVGFSLAYLSEAHCRDNFARLQRLGEEERVKVSLRDSVHRLLLNTLPAPIVRHIGMERSPCCRPTSPASQSSRVSDPPPS